MNPHGMFDTTNPHMYMDIIIPIMAKVEEAPSALQSFIFDFPTENINDLIGILGGL
jgi:hypothetical protein